MQENVKRSKKMKVFPKGQVIIPVELRRKYNINIGDRIEFITFQDGILLKPLRQKTNHQSSTDELYGMLHAYAKKEKFPEKGTVNEATESEFAAGWTE